MKPRSVVLVFALALAALLLSLLAAACGDDDCRADCAFSCANSPTHACVEKCEQDECGLKKPKNEDNENDSE